MADYSNLFESAGQKYNLDPALINAVAWRESTYDPSATNLSGGGKGAYGMLQVRQAALSDYNKANGTSYQMKDLLKPEVGVDVGAWYLGQQMDRFNDPYRALAAYKNGANAEFTGKDPYATSVMNRYSMPANQKPQAMSYVDQLFGGGKSPTQSVDPFSGLEGGKAPVQAGQVDPFAGLEEKGAKPAASPTAKAETPGALESFAAGAGKGFGSSVLGAQQLLGQGAQWLGNKAGIGALSQAGGWLSSDAAAGLARLQQQASPYEQTHPIATTAGDITGQVAPFLLGGGGGGAISKGGQMGERAAGLAGLGGAGQTAGRLAGQAAVAAPIGAAMSAVAPVSPEEQDYWAAKRAQMGTGALIGAATPVAGAALGSAANYLGNVAAAPFRPFSAGGQQTIAEQILRQRAGGAPLNFNAGEIVPGNVPTLAEATANPGIATLQRTLRDLNPAPFVAQEQTAAGARLGALERITGTADDLAVAQANRAADASDAYLSTHVGIPTKNTDFASLKQTPAFKSAYADAQRMAQNAGTSIETQVQNRAMANRGGAIGTPQTYVSGQGLHYIKQALDDQINTFAQAGEKGKAANVLNVKNRLLSLMDNEIPGYADARAQFAAQSGPIDAMQYLQSRNFTDANGNITLAKVDNAIKSIVKEQQKPGIRPAKSISDDQMNALVSLRDDLRRAQNVGLGKSAGSATAQNLATQAALSNALPGRLGAFASQLPPGSVSGAVGSGLGYLTGGTLGAFAGGGAGKFLGGIGNAMMNSQNDAIMGALTNLVVNPAAGQAALQRAPGAALPFFQNSLGRLAYPAAIGAGVGLLGK